LIHEVSAAATDDADLAELEALLDARWSRLDFGAGRPPGERQFPLFGRGSASREPQTGGIGPFLA
jgi:hypothetical protein